MDRENKSAEGSSAGSFILRLVFIISLPLFVFWVAEYHPLVFGAVLLFIVVFVTPLYFAILILDKVLRDIFSLFDR